MSKMKRWLKRYWLAETIGTATALLSAIGIALIAGSPLAIAIVAPWGENLGYYGTMLVQEWRLEATRTNGKGLGSIARRIPGLTLEFGPAELIDSLLARPFLMYMGQQLTGSTGWGIVLGKVAADIVFYVPVILSLEVRGFLRERTRRPAGDT